MMPTTSMPGSQTEMGPWRNSRGWNAEAGTWLVSVAFRTASLARPWAAPPPSTTRRVGFVAASSKARSMKGASSPQRSGSASRSVAKAGSPRRAPSRMIRAACEANERVMTMAVSSPSGTAKVIVASRAMGLSGRQVTATAGAPRSWTRRTTSSASVVEPDRETTMTGWWEGSPGAKTASGRRSTSDSGAATAGSPHLARSATAATWAM